MTAAKKCGTVHISRLPDRWSQRILPPPQRAQTAQRSTGATVPSGMSWVRVPSAASP